jgi:hypothetical protein
MPLESGLYTIRNGAEANDVARRLAEDRSLNPKPVYMLPKGVLPPPDAQVSYPLVERSQLLSIFGVCSGKLRRSRPIVISSEIGAVQPPMLTASSVLCSCQKIPGSINGMSKRFLSTGSILMCMYSNLLTFSWHADMDIWLSIFTEDECKGWIAPENVEEKVRMINLSIITSNLSPSQDQM